MRIRTRIFLGIFFLLGVGFYFLIDLVVKDIKPRYRESTEEPIVDSARVLAAIAATTARQGKIDVELFRNSFEKVRSESFVARIYDLLKTRVDLRVYITDRDGIVLFDSDDGLAEGQDYSQWRDVHLTLRGKYGARATPSRLDPDVSVLYVAAPILLQGETIGVLTVGKPTSNAGRFMLAAQRKLVLGGTILCLTLIVVGLFLSVIITHPIQRLTEYARAVRDDKRMPLPALGSGEMAALGTAFEEMRETLEGKRHVEHYVRTLTHEIKSPLLAIQGAVELLSEEMPAEQRQRFLENIRTESERIGTIVEQLLLLASLESRQTIESAEPVPLDDLLADVEQSLAPLMESRGVQLTITGLQGCVIMGERFLVRQAVLNVVQNAVEFSPPGGVVTATAKRTETAVTLTIRDHGPGIPDYARDRVFQRFYSLKRPTTGKKLGPGAQTGTGNPFAARWIDRARPASWRGHAGHAHLSDSIETIRLIENGAHGALYGPLT